MSTPVKPTLRFIGLIGVGVLGLGYYFIGSHQDIGNRQGIDSYQIKTPEPDLIIYPLICMSGDCNSAYAAERTAYLINIHKNEVVYWSLDGTRGFESTGNCTVLDKSNWSCQYADGSGNFGVMEGKFYQEHLGTATTIYYVTKDEWERAKGT